MKNRTARIQKIRTVRDARIEKLRADAVRFPERRETVITLTDARIGELCRKGKRVFYAFVNGIYTEGTPASLSSALAGQS